jgi:mono/diheme cytochrome c family protein
MRVLLLITIPLVLGAQQAPKSPDVPNGKKLFDSYGCYECHGHVGQGGSEGPRIAPKPIPLPAFSSYVRHPTNQMPPFTAKVVSDKDLADIYSYLQSIPAPPLAKEVPQLKNY